MNLTIFALQTSIISTSPLFTSIQNFDIKKNSYSYFVSPIFLNVFGKIEKSSFFHGLSSIILIGDSNFKPIKEHLSGNPFEFKDNLVEDIKTDVSLINIDGIQNSVISIDHNSFYNCESSDEKGLIQISCDTNSAICYNCFASCYSKGATTLYFNSAGSVSFITSINGTFSNAVSTFIVDNQKLDKATSFNHINVSNSNLLQYGILNLLSGSELTVSFLHFRSSYNNRCFNFNSISQISLENCEFFDLTSDFSFFLSNTEFEIRDSFFFGIIFDDFTNSECPRCSFTNCGFGMSRDLVDEGIRIKFSECYFDIEITFTNNAEFLNYGNCIGRNFSTQESILKQFATEEILGIFFCAIGIVVSLILIVIQLLKLTRTNEEVFQDHNYSQYSEYSLSFDEEELDDIEEEQPRNRKRRSQS